MQRFSCNLSERGVYNHSILSKYLTSFAGIDIERAKTIKIERAKVDLTIKIERAKIDLAIKIERAKIDPTINIEKAKIDLTINIEEQKQI